MTVETARKWRRIYCPPLDLKETRECGSPYYDGHRLFTSNQVKGIFFADNSGDNPDQTDDGALRLRLETGRIELSRDDFLVFFDVENEDGKRAGVVGLNSHTAIFLAKNILGTAISLSRDGTRTVRKLTELAFLIEFAQGK